MRISDWSSDVCSSDLGAVGHHRDGIDRDPGVVRRFQWHGAVPGAGAAVGCGTDGAQRHLRPGPDAVPVERGRLAPAAGAWLRSEEHTSELQSLMRISYAVFCLKKKKNNVKQAQATNNTK